MRRATVFFGKRVAGILTKKDDGTFTFIYDEAYLNDPDSEPVSLTLPKCSKPYVSSILFPFFFGLLAEGAQKNLQIMTLGIREDDLFSRLVYSAVETIGSVTLREIK